MSGTPALVLSVEAIGEAFRSGTKTCPKTGPIEGVAVHRLPRFVDDRGFFQKVYRAKNPCALSYTVTRTFDVNDPDEFRIPWDHPAVRDLWDIPNG